MCSPSACYNHEVRYANLELSLLISYKTILLPCPHYFILIEQSVCSGTFPAPGAGDSEAVCKAAALLGWKTQILRSLEAAVEMLWTQGLPVAIIGKRRITF